jgi:EamA domain-containing membrane protein RarD
MILSMTFLLTPFCTWDIIIGVFSALLKHLIHFIYINGDTFPALSLPLAVSYGVYWSVYRDIGTYKDRLVVMGGIVRLLLQ